MAEDKSVITKEAFNGKDTIDTALQLIRYDIPVLILGKSSIGKSYTLIDITKKWKIPHQLLYIGSEKAENIEGIPKLTDRKGGKEILEYLQPFWFPNAETITASVKNGRTVYDKFIKSYWDTKNIKKFQPNFVNLNSILNGLSYLSYDGVMPVGDRLTITEKVIDYDWITDAREDARVLNSKPFEFVKDATKVIANDASYRRDDLGDMLAYVRTVLGYGNYWLILDEIDKVEEYDKDKFAPLLHIVRERTLKNFRMIDLNDGKGLGVPLGKSFKEGGYKNMVRDLNALIDADESVLDTRVMAIANKTKNIEEALFRRFVQLIAEEVMIWRPSSQTKEQTDMEQCLINVKAKMVSAKIDSGSLIPKPNIYQRLTEINLQWQYNFFPKMLNNIDLQGNFFRSNAIDAKEKAEKEGLSWNNEKMFTAFWQILVNNFYVRHPDFNLAAQLYKCLEPDLLMTGTEIGISEKTIDEEIKGTLGIINKKVEELGVEDAAEDIADSIRERYPTEVTSEMDKLNRLYAWTDIVIEYLRAAIFSNQSMVKPIPIAKLLIPKLVNVYYTQLAIDKNFATDNIVQITNRLQAFFKEVAEVNPSFTMQCDKDSTEIAFFGETKKEIKGLSDEQKAAVSPFSLFGADSSQYINSASGELLVFQMQDGIVSAIPALVDNLGLQNTKDTLADNEGALDFLLDIYGDELQAIADRFKAQSISLKKAGGKDIASQKYFDYYSALGDIIKLNT